MGITNDYQEMYKLAHELTCSEGLSPKYDVVSGSSRSEYEEATKRLDQHLERMLAQHGLEEKVQLLTKLVMKLASRQDTHIELEKNKQDQPSK